MSTLFDTLQSEFCPPLESSLLAALLNELIFDAAGDAIEPTKAQIDDLRKTLADIAYQAEFTADVDSEDVFSASSSAPPSFYQGESTTVSSSTNSDSSSSQQSFNSPLGFLQAALPHVPTRTLNQALDAVNDTSDLDIWDVVNEILSREAAQELVERGIEEPPLPEDAWTPVKARKPTAVKKQKKKPLAKITVSDVRQQQQHTRQPQFAQQPLESDPWMQLISLCTHISSFVPPHTSGYFQSYFHKPEYASPYLAARAALKAISPRQQATEEESSVLIAMLEVLLPNYTEHPYSKVVSDAELCLIAANGRGEDALELVHVLRELDSGLDLGVSHSAATTPITPTTISSITVKAALSVPSAIPTPTSALPPISAVAAPRKHPPLPQQQKNMGQWQKVPSRRVPDHAPPRFIPGAVSTYKRDVNGTRMSHGHAGGGNAVGKGGKGDVGELKKKIAESMRRRQEMLREASKMWQRGKNSKTRGGEVALYFAEKARQFENQAKEDSLDMARLVVASNGSDPYTLDLHGTTSNEAVTIAKETLARRPPSQAHPYQIITGRGSHSVNQVSVLKPAVRKALVEDGYHVSEWDGGLTVRAKSAVKR